MKTLSITEGRKNLGHWCEKALKGEDIAITVNGRLVALRPVVVYSEDYALAEYGATPEQADQAIARAKAEIAKDEKRGRTVEFKGKIPRC